MAKLRLDLHVHSEHSRDAGATVMDLARAAKAAGLTGFALTDHNTVAGHDDIAAAEAPTGMLIIPGVEVSTSDGHLLAYGVSQAPPRGKPMQETIDLVHEWGGVAVPAHPLRPITGISASTLRDLQGISCCEGHNARERDGPRRNAAQLVSDAGLTATGGSDAHRVEDVGAAWTELEADDVAGVLEALRRGQCKADGGAVSKRSIWKHRFGMLIGRP